MRPIAIFYHVYLGGGEIPCNHDNVTEIVTDQLSALHVSRLVKASSHFEVGVNGTDLDHFMVKSMAHPAIVSKNEGVGELPTMRRMQLFCKTHPGWSVLYFHTKGAIYQGHAPTTAWRQCMENCVIWQWESCTKDLDQGGVESVGVHWLTPNKYPIIGIVPYWGGNFFWARSEFLNTLPEVNVNACRYDAEVWIGRGPRKPRVRDYAPHWPGAACIR